MKSNRVFVPFLLSVSMAIGILLGLGLGGTNDQRTSEKWEKIDQVLQYVEQDYVDSVSRQSLEEEAIAYLLQRLDPHSHYISQDDVARVNESLNGGFQGIGIEFNVKADTVYVAKTIENGPAQTAGILPGDKLIKADSVAIAGVGMSTKDVMKLLKGPSGTEVRVLVVRQGKELEYSITRGEIELNSVEAAYLMNDSTIYLRLDRFARNTYQEFMEAAVPLKTVSTKHFILDLRGNGGGFLDAAVDITDEFLAGDVLITYTEGKSRPRKEYYAENDGQFEDVQLHVLIDGLSASASEILAGAIQDHQRGVIYGKRSYGKGLVQEQNEWKDGSATRLTVARYYTPLGRSIQRPYDAFQSDETNAIDSSVNVLGGIEPDHAVKRDTTGVTWLYAEIVHRGWLIDFVYQFRDKNYEELRGLSFEEFQHQQSDTATLNALKKYLTSKGFEMNESEWNRSAELMALRIRGLLARSLFTENEYFKIINTKDEGVRAVINHIKKAEV